MTEQNPFYRDRLKELLAERCDRNPRYSVRAFSKAIDIDAGTLSRVLSGKQIPSYKLSKRIIDGLDLDTKEQRMFLSSVAELQRSRNLKRLNQSFVSIQTKEIPSKDLSIDFYRVIADWYHTAILELSLTDGFESTPGFISKELGISQTEASLALARLLELGLLKKNKTGRLIKTDEQLVTGDRHITTPALRKHQKQLLEKAIASLENDPIEERDITAMCMAIDPEKLPLAKRMIQEFTHTLCTLLESGSRKRVYNLEVALYPLQKAHLETQDKKRRK